MWSSGIFTEVRKTRGLAVAPTSALGVAAGSGWYFRPSPAFSTGNPGAGVGGSGFILLKFQSLVSKPTCLEPGAQKLSDSFESIIVLFSERMPVTARASSSRSTASTHGSSSGSSSYYRVPLSSAYVPAGSSNNRPPDWTDSCYNFKECLKDGNSEYYCRYSYDINNKCKSYEWVAFCDIAFKFLLIR